MKSVSKLVAGLGFCATTSGTAKASVLTGTVTQNISVTEVRGYTYASVTAPYTITNSGFFDGHTRTAGNLSVGSYILAGA